LIQRQISTAPNLQSAQNQTVSVGSIELSLAAQDE